MPCNVMSKIVRHDINENNNGQRKNNKDISNHKKKNIYIHIYVNNTTYKKL